MVRQAAKAIAEHLRLAEQRRKQEEAKAAAVVKASAAASKPQAAANATLHTESASSALSEKAAEAEPVGAEDAEAERPSDRNPTEELMERLRGDGVEGCRAELLQLLTSPGATLLPPPEEPRRSQDDDEPAEPPPPPPPPQSIQPRVSQPILLEARESQALPTGGEAPQAEVAAAEARPGEVREREVREREEFEDLAWRVLIVRPAAKSLSSLQRNDKRQAHMTHDT